MLRYVPRASFHHTTPIHDGWENEMLATSNERGVTVYDAESRLHETGLYDAHGVMLYRQEERAPIGFIIERKEKC